MKSTSFHTFLQLCHWNPEIPEACCFYGFHIDVESTYPQWDILTADCHIHPWSKRKRFLFWMQLRLCIVRRRRPCGHYSGVTVRMHHLRSAVSRLLQWRVSSSLALSVPSFGWKVWTHGGSMLFKWAYQSWRRSSLWLCLSVIQEIDPQAPQELHHRDS